MKKPTHAIIDADSLIYSTCSVEERPNPFVGGEFVIDLNNAYYMFEQKLKFLIERLGVKTYQLYVAGSDNFRYTEWPDYKTRTSSYREVCGRKELTQYAIEHLGAIECNGAETDDYVVYYKHKNPEALLVAIDKDVMFSCPGRHYDYWKEEYIEVSESYARYFNYLQAITGDTSDGYKGVPRIGEKKAQEGIHTKKDEIEGIGFGEDNLSHEELWAAVMRFYDYKELPESLAIQNMRMASMFQYNPETQELSLFDPANLSSFKH